MSKSADAFRTISEVAEWLDTPAHVLRFWESKFTQVKPVKRAGGRRYYRPQDMMLLGGIKKLLHEDGMTIKHVQKLLRQEGVKHVAALSSHPSDSARYAPVLDAPASEPEPEISSVVSFKADPAPVAEDEPPIVPAETTPSETTISEPAASEPAPPEPEPADTPLPFPSFLSGNRDMPQPEAEAKADEPTPEPLFESAPEPEPQLEVAAPTSDATAPFSPRQAEEKAPPAEHIDVFALLTARDADDLRVHEADLRPIMTRIRSHLARIS